MIYASVIGLKKDGKTVLLDAGLYANCKATYNAVRQSDFKQGKVQFEEVFLQRHFAKAKRSVSEVKIPELPKYGEPVDTPPEVTSETEPEAES